MDGGRQRPRQNHIEGVRPRSKATQAPRNSFLEKEDYLGIGPVPEPPKPEKKVVQVELKLPAISIPKLPVLPYKKIGFYTAGAGMFILFVFGTTKFLKHVSKPNSPNGGTSTGRIDPDFTPAVPADKPDIAKVQGATSTYDPERHVLSFSDVYEGETLLVSQQAVPANLKDNLAELDKLAASLGQKRLLQTQNGPVYVSNHPKTGQDTAVFTTDKLLIFIRAKHRLDDDIWKNYINKLKV